MKNEQQVANEIAHKERIANVLARTGGEVMHPDHYDLREAVRLAVIDAIDAVSAERGIPTFSDGDLPALFRALDAISEKVFLKSVGL